MTCEELRVYRNEHNPFAKYLGIHTTILEVGYAKGELVLKEEFHNINGTVHGGCIFTLMDTIASAAAVSHGSRMVTLSGDVNYLNPATGTSKLICEAREIKYGKKVSVYLVEVFDDKEKLLATGTFSHYNLG